MKGRKALGKLARRRKAYDASSLTREDGYKRPGSLKKPSPAGRRV